MSGFIKLHRQLIDWEWYQDSNTFRVFIHLLLKVNHRDKKWRGNLIKKGQTLTSIGHLSGELSLTSQQIRTVFNKLKSTNEITIKTSNRYTVVTLVKYSDYQDRERIEVPPNNKQPNKQATNKQQTSNNQITTNKNDKNEKNDKKRDKTIVQAGSNSLSTQQVILTYNEFFKETYARKKLKPTSSFLQSLRKCIKTEFKNIQAWQKLFNKIKESDFLMGKVQSFNRDPFQLSLEFIIKPENLAKILEGAYHR